MYLTKYLNILSILWTPVSSLPDRSQPYNQNLFENRVLGGFTCSTEEFNFIVLIMRKDGDALWQRKCGGSLLQSRWVLTAAHCIYKNKFRTYLVIAGLNDPSGAHVTVKSSRTFPHPEFNPENLFNDIGLIRLEKPIDSSKHISYVTIPRHSIEREYLESLCRTALVLGWGYLNNEKQLPDLSDLQCAFLPMLANERCRKLYYGFEVFDENVCTLSEQGKDACIGDSGGPLLCGAIQTGLVSWGVECGVPTNPGIFTRVDQYTEFIEHTIALSGSFRLCYYNIFHFLLYLINVVI